MSTHILGIRHHGPGSARSVLAALDAIQPKALLVEGPPDADELIALSAKAEMSPPIALLVYRPDEPKRAVFYPFATFSPEWQAIRWALERAVSVRFMDLPQRHRFALEDSEPAEAVSDEAARQLRQDPFALLAEAAGYPDRERWWEDHFEKRHSGPDVFTAVLELMTALREEPQASDRYEARREAWMRQTIRETQKQTDGPIAVVCGAWHAPALAKLPTVKSDAEVLRGLPKVTVAATWLPWTHRRLTFASGYGAGVHSPGYYEHLWKTSERGEVAARWMTQVAHLLRREDLESSTASVIEATRLAETAAALRGRVLPGLAEFNEAAQAVFCFGASAPLSLIRERLIVGDALGAVPEDAPQVPLQRDFQKEIKRLRLPTEALDRILDLDLRKPNDLERSRLLHRLRLLHVEWGRPAPTQSRSKGTFREAWTLRWEPELEVALIENAPWGNTILEAASRFAVHRAGHCTALPEMTRLAETLLVADLPEAVAQVMRRLENQAALTSDVAHLMEALPPLVSVMRYGNVRQTDASMVGRIVRGLVARICVGLAPACASLNDEAAAEMLTRLNATQSALATLGEDELTSEWTSVLDRLAQSDTLHGLLSGRCTRLLLDATRLDSDAAGRRLSRHLSRANAPAQAASWIEGFLGNSGLVLLHQPGLWDLLDAWLSSLANDHFLEALPLLRRTFSTFALPERRQMSELVRRENASGAPPTSVAEEDVDEARANRLLPVFTTLLGTSPPK